ncbi:MAG: lysine--tRNA ligase [Candidatus Dormibacteria bacterium]
MADKEQEHQAAPAGGLAELRQQRLRNMEAMRAAGIEPYALNFKRTESVATARAAFEARGEDDPPAVETVRLAGRVTRHRPQGKVGFADLVDVSGQIQLMAHADTLDDAGMTLFKALDLGDIVGVEGQVIRSRSGEVTLELTGLTMLTKALRPLPDKWHGLKDPELRFRHRHLDLIANPDARAALVLRSRVISHFRRFLDGRGFMEVETPVLQNIAGGAAARPFLTHHQTLDQDMSLRISLELYLKRLLVAGFEDVYEVGRVFRNEGISPRHNPEFTILELYQAYTDYEGMMELTRDLLQDTAAQVLGGLVLSREEGSIDLSGQWPRRTIEEMTREHNPGLDIADEVALRHRAAELGASRPDSLDWGAALYEVFERTAKKAIVSPVFVTGHPRSISPLARPHRDDPRLVERFELYIAGEEIADAFSELTDPIDQRSRFEQQLAARAAGVEETHPMDEDFLAALEQGMPPAGGLGIGIDRLVALLAGVPNIREVIAFPALRERPSDAPDWPEDA